jgi:hypothetical protein
MASSPDSPSIAGWQIKIFLIAALGALLTELPARALFGIGMGSDSGSPFWSTGLVVSRVAEAVLHVLFVTLLIGALAKPQDGNRQPLLANWFSAFVLASLVSEIFGLVARLALGWFQNGIYQSCTNKAQGSMATCASMPLLGIGYAVVTVATWVLFLGLLGLLAKPAGGGGTGSDTRMMQGMLLGGIVGAAQAAVGTGLSYGTTLLFARFAGGGSSSLFYFVLPLLFAVLDAAVLAVALGIWRRQVPTGSSMMAMRFE